jgi:hypothetical protein
MRRKIRRASSFCEIASRDSMSSSQSGRTCVQRHALERRYGLLEAAAKPPTPSEDRVAFGSTWGVFGRSA